MFAVYSRGYLIFWTDTTEENITRDGSEPMICTIKSVRRLEKTLDTQYPCSHLRTLSQVFLIFIEKLRQLTHVVGTLSHKGIARRALPASWGKDVVGGGDRKSK